MQVLHVTKHPYSRATRTKMQAGWTQNAIILTPIVPGEPTSFKCFPLSLAALFKHIRRGPSAIIFHEQGTLNYLFAALVLKFVLMQNNLKLIYDIHDIYAYPSVARQLYRPAELIKRFLEWTAFRIKKIKIMTVSNGLADYYEQKHGRRPNVVRSISMIDTRPPSSTRTGLIYFGAGLNRFPFDLLSLSSDQTVYYYDIKNNIKNNNTNVRYMGSYSSNDLSFLADRLALVVSLNPGSNQDHNYNTKFSLPNKFFQSLSHFLPIVIRGDFLESEDYFKSIDGFIYKWDGTENHLKETMRKICLRNFGMKDEDRKMVADFIASGFEREKSIYLKTIED